MKRAPYWVFAVFAASVLVTIGGVSLLPRPAPVAKPVAPAPVAQRWVLRITYTDDIWYYNAPDRCEVGRQAIEHNKDAVMDGMRRVVVCEYEIN